MGLGDPPLVFQRASTRPAVVQLFRHELRITSSIRFSKAHAAHHWQGSWHVVPFNILGFCDEISTADWPCFVAILLCVCSLDLCIVHKMGVLSTLFKSLPVLAASVIAVDYPPIPSDKTTPVQQRIAVNGANCELFNHNARS